MNTIEQAREVCAHLRKYSLVSPQTVDMIDALIAELEDAERRVTNRSVATRIFAAGAQQAQESKWIATTGDLIAKNAALLAANKDCVDHFNQIKADYDALIAENAELKLANEQLGGLGKQMYAELAKWKYADSKAGWINELRGHALAGAAAVQELERVKQQKPVMIYEGRCIIDCGDAGHQDVTMLKMIPKGAKLYLAAGAQPPGYQLAAERTGVQEQDKCWCDEQGIGAPGVSCGDCPRDYKQAVEHIQEAPWLKF